MFSSPACAATHLSAQCVGLRWWLTGRAWRVVVCARACRRQLLTLHKDDVFSGLQSHAAYHRTLDVIIRPAEVAMPQAHVLGSCRHEGGGGDEPGVSGVGHSPAAWDHHQQRGMHVCGFGRAWLPCGLTGSQMCCACVQSTVYRCIAWGQSTGVPCTRARY